MVALAMAPPVSSIEAEVLRIRGLMQAQPVRRGSGRGPAVAHASARKPRRAVHRCSQSALPRPDSARRSTPWRGSRSFIPATAGCSRNVAIAILLRATPPPPSRRIWRAVNINVALPASWQALQVLFRSAGRAADADTAASHVATLAKLPLEVVTATSMFADGEIHEAERIVRRYLLTHGNHVEAMRLLAKIGMKLDVLDDAEFLLESVLRARSGLSGCALRLCARSPRAAQACAGAGGTRQAARSSIPTTAPTRPRTRPRASDWATMRVRCSCTANCSQGAPQAADLHLSVAHVLKTQGKQQEAIEEYRSRRRMPAQLWRRVLEPRQSQDLSLSRRRNRANARGGGCGR